MPESPFDDPFADLFGKLPDPRSRDIGRSASEDGGGGDISPEPASAPLSRRQAREAAARQTSPSSEPEASSRQDETPPVPASATRSDEPTAPAPTETPAVDALIAASPAYARAGAAPEPRRSSPALEDLFAGTTTTDDLGAPPPPPDKRKRRIGGWIALGVVLVIFGGIAAGGWHVWSTYEDRIRAVMGWEEPKDFEAGMANGEAFLTIVSGDTGGSISPKLFEAGVTKTDDAFYDYLIAENLNPPFVPGVFALQKQMTSAAALEAIMNPANKLENSAQLREGLTVAQSLPILAEGTALPLEDFQAAVADPSIYGVTLDPAIAATGGQPLEGWLFPATYTFDPGATAQDVIQTLVNRTIQSLDAAGVPPEDRQRILTIASIIEREARFEADMQKVSTVIVNRMNPNNQETFGLLQMDSTAQYGYGEMHAGSASTSEEAQYDDNLWNTYVHTGLPVGPIANPGAVAINAAMNPAEGDWLYFVTVNLDTGETVFTSNLADHNRARDQWINWCRENPDSGC